MTYHKLFDLSRHAAGAESSDIVVDFRSTEERTPQGSTQFLGDRRGDVYIFTQALELAVNVALVTGRPLLLKGPPGSGKSTLARCVAQVLSWRYYEEVITSQTTAQDLLYKADLLRRLYDANAARDGKPVEDQLPWPRYLTPGVLWWAFDPASVEVHLSAEAQPLTNPRLHADPAERLGKGTPVQRISQLTPCTPAVVLLDEIDKADPDLPNNLLQTLGRLSFSIPELGETVRADVANAPLVVITTNGERSLPDAFLRRCIIVTLAPADETQRVKLATCFFGQQHRALSEAVSERLKLFSSQKSARPVSTAEYLDAVEVCVVWGLKQGTQDFEQTVDSILLKPGEQQMRERSERMGR